MNDTVVANFVNFTSHSFETRTVGDRRLLPHIPRSRSTKPNRDYKAGNSADWSAGVSTIHRIWRVLCPPAGRLCSLNGIALIIKPACSGWDWAQDVMINIDTTTGTVTYNPYFYAAQAFRPLREGGRKSG